MQKKRDYETIFIVKPDLEKEDREQAIVVVKKIIEDNDGEITEVNEWGMRKLAYEIDDYKSGYYTIIEFAADNRLLDELEYEYRIMDNILRSLIVRKEK